MKWDVNTLELTEILGVSRVTLYNWRCKGMPHVRLSEHKVKYLLADVRVWHKKYMQEKEDERKARIAKDFEWQEGKLMECNNKHCIFNDFGSCCHEDEWGYQHATPNELDCPSSVRADLEENINKAIKYVNENIMRKNHKNLMGIVNLMERQRKEKF